MLPETREAARLQSQRSVTDVELLRSLDLPPSHREAVEMIAKRYAAMEHELERLLDIVCESDYDSIIAALGREEGTP